MVNTQSLHNFTRTAIYSNFVTSGASATYAQYAFALSDLSGYTEFTALFDQYRINKIEFKMQPSMTMMTPGSQQLGVIASVVDYDDSTALGSFNAALEYGSCQTWNVNDTLQIALKPRMALAAYSGAFTSYANMQDQWIDAASSGVLHYGIKIACGTTTLAQTYIVLARFHFSCRSTR